MGKGSLMADDPDFIPDAGPMPAPRASSRVTPKADDSGFIPDVADADRKPLDNAPGDTLITGIAKNAATGAIKGASWIGGWAGDLEHLAALGLAGARSIFNDKTTSQNLAEQDAKEARMQAYFKKNYGAGTDWVPTSEDIAAPVLERTGEYHPTTTAGRIGQVATSGAVAAISPGGWRKAGQEILAGGAKAAPAAIAKPATHMAVGAGTAGASEEIGRYSPFAGVATAMAVPALAGKAAKGVSAVTGPVTKGGQRATAGKQLLATTADPDAALAVNPDSAVPGYKPTLADVTGDIKQAHAEGTAEKIDPNFRAQIGQQRMGQRETQANLIDTLADPHADPMAASKAVQGHVDAMTQEHDAQIQRLHQQAVEHLEAAPAGGNIEELAGNQAKLAYDSGRGLRRNLDRVADTIDPEGTMGVRPVQVQEHAREVLPTVQGQVKPGSSAAYLEAAAAFPDVIPFKQLWGFDKELTGAISQAARAGDSVGLGQLRDLKGAVKNTIHKALDNQHEWESAAVQRGELNPNDTLAGRFQRQRDEWLEARGQRQSTGSGDVTAGQAGTSGVSGTRRGPGAPGEGRGSAAGDQGIQTPPTTGLDPDTAERLALFNRGYGVYKDIYKNGPVGAGTKRAAFGDAFADPLKARSAFTAGDTGAVNTRAWLRANNSPEAVANIQAMAAQRLREAVKDGETLTPQALASWKKKYAPALRAIEEVSPGFSASFDNAAAATDALAGAAKARDAYIKNSTQGAAAKLMGLEHPEDVQGVIGKLMNGDNSAKQIQELMGRVKHDPAAVEGIRRSAANWILDNLVVAAKDTAGNPVLSSAKVESFIRKSPDTIRLLFGDSGKKVLDAIGAETARFQRTQGMKASATGSDTAQYLQQIYATLGQPGGHGLEHSADMAAVLEGIHDPIMGAKIMGSRMAFSKMKQWVQGWRQRGLRSAQDVYHKALLEPEFGQKLLRETVELENGRKMSALSAVRRLGIAMEAQHADRPGRAAGGAVGVDHAKHAARMVGLVSKIRDELARDTKPLLNVHDSAIASALAAAKEVSP
jgi:hypothetical protein